MTAPDMIEPRPHRIAPWLTAPMLTNRGVYIKVAVAATLINLFGLVTSLFSMVVYDRVAPNNAMASLVALSIGLGLVIVFDFILRMLRAYFVDIAGADIDHAVGSTVFAHTSPIYVKFPGTPHRKAEVAGAFIDEIEQSMKFIRKSYHFAKDADLALALGRFEEGRRVFGKVAAGG